MGQNKPAQIQHKDCNCYYIKINEMFVCQKCLYSVFWRPGFILLFFLMACAAHQEKRPATDTTNSFQFLPGGDIRKDSLRRISSFYIVLPDSQYVVEGDTLSIMIKMWHESDSLMARLDKAEQLLRRVYEKGYPVPAYKRHKEPVILKINTIFETLPITKNETDTKIYRHQRYEPGSLAIIP